LQKAIYDKLTLQFGLQANESVFIDDTKINIDAASAAGLQTILFENPLQLRTALMELGIL
jgi:putative hydrolase of the HAD superfamily